MIEINLTTNRWELIVPMYLLTPSGLWQATCPWCEEELIARTHCGLGRLVTDHVNEQHWEPRVGHA